VLTRTIFVPVFVWLLVEIHCGMDLPWGYDKILPPGWGGGARKHMNHHRTGKGGFEPFFCVWDALWETSVGARKNEGE
jgi:cholesterol 25-hydroxylase